MPTSLGLITIEDYSGERSPVSVNIQDIDAAGTGYGSRTQDLDEVKDAVATVIRGVIRKTNYTVVFPESEAAVSDIEAAREGKWLVSYKDTTQYLGAANTVPNPGFGKIFSFEIPTADRTIAAMVTGTDEWDLSEPTIAAPFVVAIEANYRSPYNRSAAGTPTIEVVSVKYVGRNN